MDISRPDGQKKGKRMKNVCTPLLLLLLCVTQSGCLLTKVLTVPMRVTGAVVSIVPVAGNAAHDAIDETAEAIDELPL
jgi:hypothetical protein